MSLPKSKKEILKEAKEKYLKGLNEVEVEIPLEKKIIRKERGGRSLK